MWREFDRRRCAASCGGDPHCARRAVGDRFGAVVDWRRRERPRALLPPSRRDLPLPPYPPQIFGFEELKKPVSLGATGIRVPPRELGSASASPETKLLSETKATSDETQESSSSARRDGFGSPSRNASRCRGHRGGRARRLRRRPRKALFSPSRQGRASRHHDLLREPRLHASLAPGRRPDEGGARAPRSAGACGRRRARSR